MLICTITNPHPESIWLQEYRLGQYKQAEFDALTNNEDRFVYIELIRGIEQVKGAGAISLDELKAFLRAE